MRPVISRNIWGAFWGGVLGILACGLFTPWLLPIGCLTGATLGFFYDTQLQTTGRVLKRAAARLATARWSDLNPLAGLNDDVQRTREEFDRWYHAHRYHPVGLLQRWSIGAFVAFQIVTLATVFTISKPYEKFNAFIWVSAVVLVLYLLASVLSPFCFGTTYASFRSRRYKVKQLRRFVRLGKTKFFGYCMYLQIRNALALTAIGTCALAITIIFGLGFVLTVVVPIGLAAIGLRMAKKVALIPQYALCLSTTMVVTGLSAWLFHRALHGTGLWLIALATGCLSALVTESLRRSLARAVPWMGRQKVMTEYFSDLVGPHWDALTGLGGRLLQTAFDIGPVEP